MAGVNPSASAGAGGLAASLGLDASQAQTSTDNNQGGVEMTGINFGNISPPFGGNSLTNVPSAIATVDQTADQTTPFYKKGTTWLVAGLFFLLITAIFKR